MVDIKREFGEITLNVTGDANIADTSISELNVFGISSNTGIVSTAYDFVSDHKFQTAKITFKLDSKKVAQKGASFSDLSVLKFDASTQSYEKIKSRANSSAGTISADINTYGTYVVGTEKKANSPAVTKIAFLLDNSGSMYPVEECETSPENDVNFKRLDFTKSLINKIEGEGDYLYSIAKFTGTYTQLQKFTADTEKLNNALEKNSRRQRGIRWFSYPVSAPKLHEHFR